MSSAVGQQQSLYASTTSGLRSRRLCVNVNVENKRDEAIKMLMNLDDRS